MPAIAKLGGVVIDVNNFEHVKEFWMRLLNVEVGNEFPGMAFLKSQDGTAGITIQQVPEPKSGKNRVHPDLSVENLDEAERQTTKGQSSPRTGTPEYP